MHRVTRGLAVALLGLLAALAAPTPASAHAYLARSAPADGAVVDRAPELLRLSFTEPVELSATRVDIVDGDGRRYLPTAVTLAPAEGGGAVAIGVESPVDVLVGLPPLPPNVYHVTWRTLSSDDLHATSGNLVIGVQRQVPTAARPPGPGGPVPLEAALRALALLGLSTVVGGAALALLLTVAVRPAGDDAAEDARGALRRRLLDTARAGGCLALVAIPAQLAAQAAAGAGGGAGLFLREATSGRWLAREAGVGLLVAAIWWAAPEGRGRGRTVAAIVLGCVGAVCAATGTALLGHRSGGTIATAVTGAVHVLAAGGWAGSVVAGAVALVPVLRAGQERAGQWRGHVALLLRSFALLAVGCLAALAVTGLVLAGAQVATVDALLTTPYGLLLLAKVAAVGVAGALGLRTNRRLRGPGAVPVGGLVTEAAVLVGVLALAGGLASAGPARGPRFAAQPKVSASPQVSGQVADLVDTVAIRPNRPGRNVITITVSDTRRPALAPITGVSVILRAPDGTQSVHPVARGADGGWAVTVDDIRNAGTWKVSVTVQREGLRPVTDVHDWGVAAGGQASAPVVSAAPLRPVLTGLAGSIALVSVAVAVLVGYRRRRRSERPDAPESTAARDDDRAPAAVG